MVTTSPLQVTTHRRLSSGEIDEVTAFLDAARRDHGAALSDHLTSDLRHGRTNGFLAALATRSGAIVGYAQASPGNEGLVVGCVAPTDEHVAEALMRRVLAESPADIEVTWWTDEQTAPVATGLGMTADRRLLEMRASLPLVGVREPAEAVSLRPFRVGHDEAAWLEVNNAAFAWHGEQGGWTLTTLQQREHETWFDPEGFLLHERDGRLAAFCWTKLHRVPHLVGEIYVIAVHPDFHGLGLGRALTVAGLEHIRRAGATEAMLFVDADNAAAVALYDRLGFIVARTELSFRRAATRATIVEGSPT